MFCVEVLFYCYGISRTVPVVDGPLTGPEPVSPTGEPIMGIFNSASVSDAMTGDEHPLAEMLVP